jgi:hypothetical protein
VLRPSPLALAAAALFAACGGNDSVVVQIASATCTFVATSGGQDQYEVHWIASASGPAGSFLTGDSVPCASCTGSDSTFTCDGWSVYDPHTCQRQRTDVAQATLDIDERDLFVTHGQTSSVTLTAYAWSAGSSYASAQRATTSVTCAQP